MSHPPRSPSSAAEYRYPSLTCRGSDSTPTDLSYKLFRSWALADSSIEAIRKSGGRLNEWGIKEMLDYLRRIGYKPDDLNKLNVVHITGTKGKGSTSAFAERILRDQLGGKIGKSAAGSLILPS